MLGIQSTDVLEDFRKLRRAVEDLPADLRRDLDAWAPGAYGLREDPAGTARFIFASPLALEGSLTRELTGSWWRTTVRLEALERFLPSFRGPHASAGFRVFGAAMTYIAYLDEFGHIGPYIARDDARHNDSPVSGT